MGVPGLWDLLRPAAARTSLAVLARDAVLANRHELRALTIGIDASIWIFHAQVPMQGENPFLRTIFYKVAALLQQPVLPVFVFDGPRKPSQKRNQAVTGHFGTADHKSKQFKALLDVCGLEWWNAPGEAEAELAIMNRQGKIDAVMSDDVDALLFGATCLLRNNSPTLSGAQGSILAKGVYEVFRSSAIRDQWSKKEGTKLVTEEDCRMAMILIAMLAGGDYAPEGLEGFGPTIAFALANAGFAEFLKLHISNPPAFRTELSFVHGRLVDELRTNSTGHIGRKQSVLADRLAALDPSSVFTPSSLEAYLHPATSPINAIEQGWPGFGKGDATRIRGKARNDGRGDLEGFATACETYFEWGTRELVTTKFMGEQVGLFASDIMHTARETLRHRDRDATASGKRSPLRSRVVQASDHTTSPSSAGNRITSFFGSVQPRASTSKPASPPKNKPTVPSYVIDIRGGRVNSSSPSLVEYRIGYKTQPFVDRVQAAMQGIRPDPRDLASEQRLQLGLVDRQPDVPSASSAAAIKNKDDARVWMPEYLVREAWPDLVKVYDENQKSRSATKKGGGRATKQRPKNTTVTMDSNAFKGFFVPSQSTTKQKKALRPKDSSDAEIEVLEDWPTQNGDASSQSNSKSRRSGLSSSPLSSLPSSRASTPIEVRLSSAVSPKKKGRPAPSTSASSGTRSARATPDPISSSPKVRARRVVSVRSVRPSGISSAGSRKQSPARKSTQASPVRVRSKRATKRATLQSPASDQGPTSPVLLSRRSASQSTASSSKSATLSPASPPSSPNSSRKIAVLLTPPPRTRASRNVSPKRTVSPKRQISVVCSGSSTSTGGKDEPIDLCSSDNEETPKAARITRKVSKDKASSAKGVAKSKQTLIDFAVTAHITSSPISGKPPPSWEEERWERAMSRGFVVLEETDDAEWIDCTRSS
ncbi:hypothetical protein BCR39DRAFT_543072 [Naematelia encephala]|uniref:XPG-I domain-containing protein n=1 Tax=Naematelia encephala TaxID=71784 RepID=A0A1Y2ATV4_9TREE|nr:hypothetical protein BCR39DRAFT_543072 [Naematelia encephala]